MNALPLNSFKYEIPEDVTKSSQRLMNLWVGALSPMWVPFMAATSFGVGAWMLSKGLGEALTKGGVDFKTLMSENPAMAGLKSMEKAIDEAVSAPMKAFVEAETILADKIIGDYSAPPEAVEAALKAEAAEAKIESSPEASNAPRPMAQKLAVAPQKCKKPTPAK